MNARINRELFTQRTFDSGALGVMSSVIHQFARPGRYQAQVEKSGVVLGTFSFVVDEKSNVMQLDVDLATIITQSATKKAQDCGCRGTELRSVSPKGYVLFYASSGSGYAVKVGFSDAKEVIFDSQALGAGDFFALSLLEPTHYTINDRIGGGKGEITVSFSREDAKRLNALEPVSITVSPGKIDPSQINLTSTQGLIFRATGKARIVIEKIGRAEEPEKQPPIVRRWEKLR